jgi:Ca-activated chloride channel homolog
MTAMKSRIGWMASGLAVAAVGGWTATSDAAGTLTPIGATEQPIRIVDHSVRVVINNGFAMTEVSQTFLNPNDTALEAVYSFPVPRSASLSEVVIASGESEIHGEVLTKDEADRLYQEEKDAGNEAGLATKNSYLTFEFHVSRVLPNDETKMRFVYYQPLEIDLGVGRYVYPLECGGTDEAGAGFWTANEQVDGSLTIDVELKSAIPVEEVRAPGFEMADVKELAPGHRTMHIELPQASLNRDFVFYYRLPEDLPGRVELIPYRADKSKPGTFMLVVTPGLDLQPLAAGADYCFVLDVSGSMETKLKTLGHGVAQAIGKLRAEDRFRVVTFSEGARELIGWQTATPENVKAAIQRVESLKTEGGTNVYEGLSLGLKGLDADRATSLILVTDGVTNTGIVDPKKFHELMSKHDVRVFGFLMGNSANWPLMQVICDATGGFYTSVSNSDDILGQILLAKSKVTHECLHDATLKVGGVKMLEMSDEVLGKVYQGEQLVLFGRYAEPGKATVTLTARLTGEDKTYTTTVNLPELDTDNPEIERLAAMRRIEEIEVKALAGLGNFDEAKSSIESLGVEYQLVTDYTSMVVLADEVFERHGIERRNRQRTTVEHDAQARRAAAPARSYRADESQPMFTHRAPTVTSSGRGGGAIDPISGVVVLVGVGAAAVVGWRRRKSVG